MTIIVGVGRVVSGDIVTEVTRLRALASDLERIADGSGPRREELQDAPLIEGWVLSTRPLPCLVGRITGHPTIRGPVGQTTDLWAYAPALGWARTLSRFYRIGVARDPHSNPFAFGKTVP